MNSELIINRKLSHPIQPHIMQAMPIKRFFLCVSILAALWTTAAADHSSLPFVSPMFGDNMVLQRGKPDRDLGLGETRATSSSGNRRAHGKGRGRRGWPLAGADSAAGARRALHAQNHRLGQTVELHEVLVGDVWLCGGQSNMELGIGLVE